LTAVFERKPDCSVKGWSCRADLAVGGGSLGLWEHSPSRRHVADSEGAESCVPKVNGLVFGHFSEFGNALRDGLSRVADFRRLHPVNLERAGSRLLATSDTSFARSECGFFKSLGSTRSDRRRRVRIWRSSFVKSDCSLSALEWSGPNNCCLSEFLDSVAGPRSKWIDACELGGKCGDGPFRA